ncbi:hypothetical protein [Sporisorium scitamineum]|uniref:Cytochrome b5 heme-binding domain-containing protein n=1 Tax=Sporisorium scitamineum TaxID=49012 RepID=A0A0F7RYB7_9BASI|nr:hypothetical protein [Sporisorium scitamineum]
MSEVESKKITMEQLKEHGSHDDLWLLIDGKVYDVSKFLDEVGFVSFSALGRTRASVAPAHQHRARQNHLSHCLQI